MPHNAAELLVTLAGPGRQPLRVRVANALRDAIRSGQLTTGATLPSSRILAQDLGCSRGVVVDAYAQLTAEGFLHSRPGAATTVAYAASVVPAPRPGRPPEPAPAAELDLRPGWPDLSTFPRTAWATATRDVLRDLPDARLGYCEPWGSWEFRRVLSTYLSRVRAAMAGPEDIVAVSGVTQGLTLLCRLLIRQGVTRIGIEDPSNAVQAQLLARLGMSVVRVPVDESGLQVDQLAGSDLRVVLCTPAHQYPSGVALAPRRRAQLLQWAKKANALIIEDDCDAEFRYDRAPLSCLQGMDPEHVALLGSVSKTLAPALRLGWVLTPPSMLADVRGIKRDDDFGSNALVQYVLARLMDSGQYDRHVRALQRRYRLRRDAFIGAINARLPGWHVMGSAGGLHVTVSLPPELSEGRLVAAAESLGLSVLGLSTMSGDNTGSPAIVVSYARTTPDLCEEAVRRLALAAQQVEAETSELETTIAEASLLWQDPL